MGEAVKPDPARVDEERLAHALISRGLLTREEVQGCLGRDGDFGPEPLLARLTAAGLLTANQAQRARQELKTLLAQKVPGYQFVQKLGQGGMGTVYKARQLSMNRLVAIKVLNASLARNAEYLDRFRREAHLAAKLSHNNIVQAIDVGSAGSVHYFVMELVEGRTIRQELETGKIYSEHEAVEIILQVAQAMEHASKRGLTHRDIKPANIVMTEESIAKLADLGLARDQHDAARAREEKGVAMGTPHYMAPEQILAKDDIDVRADIYSLGATLYHMVTGRPPFPHVGIDDILNGHLREPLTPPDHIKENLSSGLGEVVEFMMAKQRGERYQTPADVIIDLECLFNGDPPRLARQRIEAASLQDLAEGESDAERRARRRRQRGLDWVWVAVLGGVLAFSLVVNMVLFMLLRRG